MLQKTLPPQQSPSPLPANQTVSEPPSFTVQTTAETPPLAKIRKLLEANHLDEALKLAHSHQDPQMKNALGVCLMRKGQPHDAVRLYRHLVLDHTGLFLRPQSPVVYKTNFAYALMLCGKIIGGLNILKEVESENHPCVQELKTVAEAYKAKLSLFQKIGLCIGLDPQHPFVLDFPAGDLI